MEEDAPVSRGDASMKRASFCLVFLIACAAKGPISTGDKPAWVSTPNGDVRFPADKFVAAVGSVSVGTRSAPELLAAVDAAAREAVMKAFGPAAADVGMPAAVEIAGRWRQGDTAYAWGVFDKAKALAAQQSKMAAAEKEARDLFAAAEAEVGEKPADAMRDYAKARIAADGVAAPAALVRALGGTPADVAQLSTDAESKVSALRGEMILSVVEGDQQRAAEHKPLPSPIVFSAWLKGKRAAGLPMLVSAPGGSTEKVAVGADGKAEAKIADSGVFSGAQQSVQIAVDWPALVGSSPAWISGPGAAITATVLRKGVSTTRVLVLAQEKSDRSRLTAALKDSGFSVQDGEALLEKFGAARIAKMSDAQLREAAKRVADVVVTGSSPVRAVDVASGKVLYSGPVGSALVEALKKSAAE